MSKLVEKRFMLIRNLVYMFYLTNPEINAGRLWIIWDSNKVLKEYPRPRIEILKSMIKELKNAVN